MAIIAVTNQKGGVGKSTVALNLARGLQRHGSVILVDADPQCSIHRASTLPTALLPEVITDVDPSAIIRAGTRADFVIVDTMPHVIPERVIDIANLCLVPVRPSGFDLWATEALVEALRKHGAQAAFVVSNARRNNLAGEMPGALASYGIPVLRTTLWARTAVEYAAMLGQAVADYEPKSESAREFGALTKEVRAILKGILPSL